LSNTEKISSEWINFCDPQSSKLYFWTLSEIYKKLGYFYFLWSSWVDPESRTIIQSGHESTTLKMLVLLIFRLQRKQHHLCPRCFHYQHQSSRLSECLPCQPCLHLLHLEFCNSGNCYCYRHLLVVFHCRYFCNFLDKDSQTFKRKHSLTFHISVWHPICRCRENTLTCYRSNYLIFFCMTNQVQNMSEGKQTYTI